MFTFDPKGSNTLIEAKEAVAKIQGKCNYGMVTLAEYKSVASLATTSTLPISGKQEKILSYLHESINLYKNNRDHFQLTE